MAETNPDAEPSCGGTYDLAPAERRIAARVEPAPLRPAIELHRELPVRESHWPRRIALLLISGYFAFIYVTYAGG